MVWSLLPLQGLLQHVWFPDMPLPLNAADEALAHNQTPPVPLMSFCRPKGMIDILIPNMIEGDVFHLHGVPAQMGQGLQSGRGDKRKPRAVWRGTVVRECLPPSAQACSCESDASGDCWT